MAMSGPNPATRSVIFSKGETACCLQGPCDQIKTSKIKTNVVAMGKVLVLSVLGDVSGFVDPSAFHPRATSASDPPLHLTQLHI